MSTSVLPHYPKISQSNLLLTSPTYIYIEVWGSAVSLDKNILLENMNQPIDFYTGEKLQPDDISVDHVIPWSFMYSDDIWNLVLTSKSHNSSKSNHIPSKEVIEQLNQRNKELVETINNSKYKEELNIAIAHSYVDQFYLSMKL